MTPGERLKAVQKHLGLTQSALAAGLGVKMYKINDIELDKLKLAPELAQIIESKFAIDFKWLLTGEGSMLGDQQDNTNLVSIPLYAATASAGAGSINEGDDIIDHCRFKIDWIKKTLHANPRKLALIRISGDSMEPTLRSGDVIMINRELDDPSDGKIYVVNLGGQVVAKRIQVTGRDKIDLISDNRIYPIVPLGPQSRITGRVVWFGRKLI
jgi:phage repressor protein C with HTH and peptisase S24 domain